MASGLRNRLQKLRKRRGIATISRRQGGVVFCTSFHERHVCPAKQVETLLHENGPGDTTVSIEEGMD